MMSPHQTGADDVGGPTVAPRTGAKSIFISYARRDHEKTRQVVEGLEMLGNDVWLDEGLVAGQEWWDAILARIRSADVFVQTISPAAMKSVACDRERKYAHALGKPILPVALEPVAGSVLPSDVAELHFIDYSAATPEAAF